MKNDLSADELLRYSRHLNLPDFGLETQQKLKDSKVLVVGTGGLGAPLLQYLTASGVGTIGVVDYDRVDKSNLQRQVLFGTSDVGKYKTEAAIERLKDLNPHVNFIEHRARLTSENALGVIEQYDVVADGTDNFPTRYLVNDACVLAGKTNVYASIFQYEGQVSVFNLKLEDGRFGPNYRDLFPTPPPPGMVPSCAEGGVLGVLPGIIGSLQALEVIKVLTGIGESLSGRLLVINTGDLSMHNLKVKKDPQNPLTGENPSIRELIDYEEFCGVSFSEDMPTLSVQELKSWMDSNRDFMLVDVRESHEHKMSNLSDILLPQSEFNANRSGLPKDKPVVIYCRSGVRSGQVVKALQDEGGFSNVFNLEGGILAWKEHIQPDMEVL